MKVLQINSVCGIGSTGRMATDFYQILKDQGHNCKIAYGRGTAPDNIDTIKIGSNKDNYLHALKTRILDQHGFGSEGATTALINKIENYDPDVIHLHNIHGYYLNIEILFDYLKSAGKPVVWTLHDCWAFTGHCAYFDYVGCDKWKTGCYDCPQKKEYPSSIFFDNSKRNYQRKKELFTSVENLTIVSPSNWLANLAKQSFLGKYPIQVIHNGIDLNVFQPTPGDFRKKYDLQDRFIILGIANVWEERKGLKHLIELSKTVSSEHKIVVVGVTERQKKSLPANILALTRTNSIRQLAEIYTAADVFVNPTLEETFGLVNIEALACGTPVVTFDTGGSPETIDNTCGLVVEKGNTAKLVKAVFQCTQQNFSSNDCIEHAKLYEKNNSFGRYIDIDKGIIK